MIAIGLGAVTINVAMNLYLFLRYSYNGAAVATLIPEFSGFVSTFLVARQLASVEINWAFIWRAAAATGAGVLAAAAVWNVSPWIALVLGQLALFAVAFMLGAMNRIDELRYVPRRVGS